MTKKEKYYKVYQAWADMRYKCNNPKAKTYKSFGGRGITHSARWDDYNNFREDMLPSYLELVDSGKDSRKITLGRIDKNKNFSVENCVWMTPSSQYKVLAEDRVNCIVASRLHSTEKHVFKTLQDMASFYNVSRTGASNALHRNTFYIRDVIFNKISLDDYNRALIDKDFLNSLEIKYDKEMLAKKIKKGLRELLNKL